GYHVAIAEQVGTIARNGLVPREIVRVLTPGMLLETDLLTGARANFLLTLVRTGSAFGLAYVDVSTGELLATSVDLGRAGEYLAAERVRIGPAEVLIADDDDLAELLPPGAVVTRRGVDVFAPVAASRAVARRFGGAPETSGLGDHPAALHAL